ncbi:hypothetical protein OF846_000841 [Rhodotorula toruloides]|nr:hypothetical protein OF846_000841 [Rhodotorula toruloides]
MRMGELRESGWSGATAHTQLFQQSSTLSSYPASLPLPPLRRLVPLSPHTLEATTKPGDLLGEAADVSLIVNLPSSTSPNANTHDRSAIPLSDPTVAASRRRTPRGMSKEGAVVESAKLNEPTVIGRSFREQRRAAATNRDLDSLPHPLIYTRAFVSLFISSPLNYSTGSPSRAYKRAQALRRRERAKEKRKLETETRRVASMARRAKQEESEGGAAGGASRGFADATVDGVVGGLGRARVRKVEVVAKEVVGEKEKASSGAEGDEAPFLALSTSPGTTEVSLPAPARKPVPIKPGDTIFAQFSASTSPTVHTAPVPSSNFPPADSPRPSASTEPYFAALSPSASGTPAPTASSSTKSPPSASASPPPSVPATGSAPTHTWIYSGELRDDRPLTGSVGIARKRVMSDACALAIQRREFDTNAEDAVAESDQIREAAGDLFDRENGLGRYGPSTSSARRTPKSSSTRPPPPPVRSHPKKRRRVSDEGEAVAVASNDELLAEPATPKPATKAGRRTTPQKKPTRQKKSAKQAGKARAPTSPLADLPTTSATPSAADSSRRIEYQNTGSSPDPSSTLDIGRSDFLAATAPEAVTSESSDVLLGALLNIRLPEAVRHAAHEELLRRSSDGRLYVPLRPSPVVEMRPSSPRIPSPRPPSPSSSVDVPLASVFVAVEDPDGTPIEVNLTRSSSGLPDTDGVQGLRKEAENELASCVTVLVGGAGDESAAKFVPAHGAMSVAQACDLVDSLLTKLVTPPPRPTPPGKSNPGSVRLSPEQQARLRIGPRHPLAPPELDNILAACVVISTFYNESLDIAASKSTARSLLDRFDKSATVLLSHNEKDALPISEQIKLLDRRLSTSALILAQQFSAITPVAGQNNAARRGMRNGAYLDWDALFLEIQPRRPDLVLALERVLPRLASREGDTGKSADWRFIARRDLSLSLQEAVDRVVVSQPEVAFRDAEQADPVDRSPEAVSCHPAYTIPIFMLDTAFDDLLEQFEAEAGLRGEVTGFELNIEKTPAFAAALRAAHLAAKYEVDGHPPITTGLALEAGQDAVSPFYQNSSVNILVWKPFVQEWWKRKAKPRLDAIHRNAHASSSNERSWKVEINSERPGLSAIRKATTRPNDASVAIEDGKNLANMTGLFNLASQARLAPKLAPMHDKDQVWQCEAEYGGVAQQATSILDYLSDKIASPIVHYAARQPPMRRFDEGEQDWTRPERDDLIHGATRGQNNAGGRFSSRLVSHCGLLVIQTQLRQATGAAEMEELPYDFSHLRPPVTPPSGASDTAAEDHRNLADLNQPWQPFATISSQADHLNDFLDSLDPALFLQVRSLLEQAIHRPTASKGFGQHYTGRNALDAFFLLNYFLRLLTSENLIDNQQAQDIHTFMATSLSLAALSPRPALFAPLIPVMIHKMALALDDEAQAGRLEVLLSLLEQQYKGALLGLLQHTDADSFYSATMHDDITKVAILFDLLVNGGTCASCGRATFAMKEYQPTRSREDEEDRRRTLSWTTLSAARVVADVATLQQVVYGQIGGDGWGYSLLGCAYDFEQKNNLSLASRAADKGTTTLAHKRCKVERGKTTAYKVLIGDAVARGEGGGGGEAGGRDG